MSEAFLESIRSAASGGAFPGIGASDIIGYIYYWTGANSKTGMILKSAWDGSSALNFCLYYSNTTQQMSSPHVYMSLTCWDIYGGVFTLTPTGSTFNVTGSQKYISETVDLNIQTGSATIYSGSYDYNASVSCTDSGTVTSTTGYYNLSKSSGINYFPILSSNSRSDSYLCDLIIIPRRSRSSYSYTIMDLLIFIFLFSTHTKKGG